MKLIKRIITGFVILIVLLLAAVIVLPIVYKTKIVEYVKAEANRNLNAHLDFNPDISSNPFAYFTQIIYYAFHRRISKEEKARYIIYKKFQESVLDTNDASLMIDADDNHLISSTMYDNLNDFIRNFEAREQVKKEKRKEKKEGLEKFVENDDEGRESV